MSDWTAPTPDRVACCREGRTRGRDVPATRAAVTVVAHLALPKRGLLLGFRQGSLPPEWQLSFDVWARSTGLSVTVVPPPMLAFRARLGTALRRLEHRLHSVRVLPRLHALPGEACRATGLA